MGRRLALVAGGIALLLAGGAADAQLVPRLPDVHGSRAVRVRLTLEATEARPGDRERPVEAEPAYPLDAWAAWFQPLRLALPEGSELEARPLEWDRGRGVRVALRERPDRGGRERVVTVPMERSSRPTEGELRVPLESEPGTLLLIRLRLP